MAAGIGRTHKRQPSQEKTPPGKREKTATGSYVKFERAFEMLNHYGIIDAKQKETFLKRIITSENQLKTSSEILQSLIERIGKLSNSRFTFTYDTGSASGFRKQVDAMSRAYILYITSVLRECGEATLMHRGLEYVPDHLPSLPFRIKSDKLQPIPKTAPTTRALFQSIYDFFKQRKDLLREQQVVDDIERVIYHMWISESKKLVCLAEGYASLDLCSQICRFLQKGDFHLEKKKLEWKNKIEKYEAEMSKECKKLAGINFNNQSVEIFDCVEETTFPLEVIRGIASPPSCVTIAKVLLAWLEWHQILPMLQGKTDLLVFLMKVRVSILKEFDKHLLHHELTAYDRLCTALMLEEAFNNPFKYVSAIKYVPYLHYNSMS